MRTRQAVLDYGLSFPNTYQDAPFHDTNWQLVRCRENKFAGGDKYQFIENRKLEFVESKMG